jgi:sugar (pentulose or hexulose) kinase
MLALGLDVGSTSIKGAVLDLERGEVRGVAQTPFPAPLKGLPTGCFEVEPAAIVRAMEQIVARLLEAAPEAEALFCAGQMGGTLLVDEGGAALTNYLSWRDQRTLEAREAGGSYIESIRRRWTDEQFVELGSELLAGSTSSLLFWLAQNNQLQKGAMPATVADYVLGRLCNAPPAMHPTHAIGLLDLRTKDWHHTALQALGLEQVRWPQLAGEREPIGSYHLGGRRIACHAAIGDQQCALRGVGLTRDEISLNVSTGSQVSRRTAQFEPGPYQSRRYFHGDYLNTITHLPAGRSLNVLLDLLTEFPRANGVTLPNPWECVAQQAAATNGGGLNVDLAFFTGPLGSSGRIDHVTTENLTIGNLFRAAFENMADNYLRCADRLGPDRAGLRLALSGGLTRAVPILRELIQQRFNLPLRESAAQEETMLGLLDVARETYGR